MAPVERTAWTRNFAGPLRAFLGAETAAAAGLVGATVAALVWSNAAGASYTSFWHTILSVQVDGHGIELDLREWVNAGLMSFFFFVMGLEARRELDVGELRERRRTTLPLAAGLAGMLVPVLIYVAFNAGRPTLHGWGTAMSTDTAFALGVLALLGRGLPERLRAFLVTVLVVDDLVALVVIVAAYSSGIDVAPLLIAVALFAAVVAALRLGVTAGLVYLLLGAATWVALLESGIEPIVVGLAMGLLTYAAPSGMQDLQRASDLFRLFREQPTPELARVARSGVQSAVSPNERLQLAFLPWTSYAIVPLFALANAGVTVSGDALRAAVTSPVTLGIVVGYVVGKPIGIAGATLLVSAFSPKLRPPVGWLSVVGGAAAAGTGFTVSLLIAGLAFDGAELQQAKIGILAAALLASLAAAAIARGAALLPVDVQMRALLGRATSTVDLADPVDPERDRWRGAADAPVTLVEYGDFECPYCGRAENAIEELMGSRGDVRYVWRHLPLADVHPNAQRAAEAVEAAAAQGKFWELHDLLLDRQDALPLPDLLGYAEELGLDVDRFADDLRRHAGSARIADDVESADRSGVAGTPTFFVNGRRHWGAYDAEGLARAVGEALARATV
jgi:Na+/H+ antiporter NhaA